MSANKNRIDKKEVRTCLCGAGDHQKGACKFLYTGYRLWSRSGQEGCWYFHQLKFLVADLFCKLRRQGTQTFGFLSRATNTKPRIASWFLPVTYSVILYSIYHLIHPSLVFLALSLLGCRSFCSVTKMFI